MGNFWTGEGTVPKNDKGRTGVDWSRNSGQNQGNFYLQRAYQNRGDITVIMAENSLFRDQKRLDF